MNSRGGQRSTATVTATQRMQWVLSNSKRRRASADPSGPSFFVVGPPRTGSSWLHQVLAGYTNLPSPTKETRFFDLHFGKGWNWYQAHFPVKRPDRPMGEVAPTYFASAQARERLACTLPFAKLVFTFRHPVQRVISLYRVKRAYGLIPWNFEEALDRDPELLASGQYATHLRAWQRSFPSDQLLITIYDDLRKSPQEYVNRLTDFIGAPRIALNDETLRRVHSSDRLTEPRSYLLTRTASAIADWCKEWNMDSFVAGIRNSRLIRLFLGGGAPFPEVSGDALQRIWELFYPEVECLERILGRDLSSWKLVHPMVPEHINLR